jgi:hypothetical protein
MRSVSDVLASARAQWAVCGNVSAPPPHEMPVAPGPHCARSVNGDSPTVPVHSGALTPALQAVSRIAIALGPLRPEIIFIGGAIASLLQTEQILPNIRPTKDVDGICASSSYVDYGRIQSKLRELGFRETMPTPRQARPHHAHRWDSPDGTWFDLVPSGAHLGGTGSSTDAFAIASALELELSPDIVIRHASAVGFLALKCAAYGDRGNADPFMSEDLEDIIALVASRATIVDELSMIPFEIRDMIAHQIREILANQDSAELILAHLGQPLNGAAAVARVVTSRLEMMGRQAP